MDVFIDLPCGIFVIQELISTVMIGVEEPRFLSLKEN